jgi:hypothetical protein
MSIQSVCKFFWTHCLNVTSLQQYFVAVCLRQCFWFIQYTSVVHLTVWPGY